MSTIALRSLLALATATLIAFGMVAQLDWLGWQPIGWAVIMASGYLAVTHSEGFKQQRVWLVAGPAASFLLGYTALNLAKPVWIAIDSLSIVALAVYAALEWRTRIR